MRDRIEKKLKEQLEFKFTHQELEIIACTLLEPGDPENTPKQLDTTRIQDGLVYRKREVVEVKTLRENPDLALEIKAALMLDLKARGCIGPIITNMEPGPRSTVIFIAEGKKPL